MNIKRKVGDTLVEYFRHVQKEKDHIERTNLDIDVIEFSTV